MESFEYNVIDLEGSAFRLIRLLKGDDDFIHCHLFDAWLDQQESVIDYAALSYTWGEAEKPYDIIVNGSRLAVTKNLYLALRHLRRQDQDRILWIDAICINQDNHRERGHQVQQMASIYKKAERVIIWLGTSTYDTDLIMNFMGILEKESLRYICNNWKISDLGWANIWSSIQTGSSHILLHRQQEGLKSLLARSWFKRVWILQEVANARTAEIICGTKSVSAKIFALTPLLAGISPDHQCQAVLDIMPGPSRKSSWWTQKQDLRTLLAKFGKSEASDPRDVIYALLGISSDVSKSDYLKANYEKSVEEVIQDTTFFMLGFPESGYPTYGFPRWTLQEFLANIDCLSYVILEWALKMRYESVVKLLLWRGDVSIDTEENRMLLLMAVTRGKEEIVRVLVDGGLASDVKDQNGETALHKAILKGQEAIAQLLIDSGAAIDIKDQHGETALHKAASKESKSLVRILVDSGADVNAKNLSGETALYKAAFRFWERTVHLQAQFKADVNAKNEFINKLLHEVPLKQSNTMVQLLVDLGADINAKNQLGNTALHEATIRWSDTIVKLLVDLGADINAKNQLGNTALHEAILNRNDTIVQQLVDLGVGINAKNRRRNTALHEAILNWNDKIVQLLVDLGADINAKNKLGNTALHEAILNRNDTIVQLLVDLGADINAKNQLGNTALHEATLRWSDTIVQLLVNLGADINAKNKLGNTALDHAARAGRDMIVQFLVDHGAIIKGKN